MITPTTRAIATATLRACFPQAAAATIEAAIDEIAFAAVAAGLCLGQGDEPAAPAPEPFAARDCTGHAKLTAADVVAIRAAAAAGDTQRLIASRFGVARGTVGRIITGRMWAGAGGQTRPPRRYRRRAVSRSHA